MDQTLKSKIVDLTLTSLAQLGDERGAVLQMMRSNSPDFTKFGECYCSEILPGAVKAWKRHRLQTQNLAVPVGHVRLVVYDDRVDSPSNGVLEILDLGRPEAYVRVRIPPGLWYGFANLGTTPAMILNCTDIPHDPTEGERRSEDDPAIPYRILGQGTVL